MNGLDPKRRYQSLIAATLRSALDARPHYDTTSPGTLPIEVALPCVAQKLGITFADSTRKAIDTQLAEAPDVVTFVDGFGHRRPMYRCLALRALAKSPLAERWTGTFLSEAVGPLQRFVAGGVPIVAANGNTVAACVFQAFAVSTLAATHDAHSLADQTFDRLADHQQADGTFLSRTQSDNPEPLWYEELAILHAVWTYAAGLAEGPRKSALLSAATRAASYHAAEVQPDHASSHPWAIAAFLSIPDGIQLADMMLHAAGVQQPSAMDAVSLLLLADAVLTSR